MQVSNLQNPFVLINFKTYLESSGQNALNLAKIIQEVSQETGISMGVAVPALDIKLLADELSIPVFAQHIDAIKPGSNTGWILPEAVREAGAVGTLINHSEHRVGEVGKYVEAAKRVGLISMVCAEDDDEALEFLKFDPDYLAVEPPELIGGDVSVSTAQPELISGAVEKIGSEKVVVGAGVKTGEDVKIAKELGASGVLVASGVCKAEDPKRVLMDFAKNLM